MRRTGIWLGLMAMVVATSGAFAAPSGLAAADGDWNDWFTYPGDTTNVDWDQVGASSSLDPYSGIRFQNAPAGEHDHGAALDALGDGTTPVGGGQPYDVEQIFYYFEDYVPGSDTPANTTGGILHIGLVTGFPPGGTTEYLAGDFFIGFGSGAGYAVAVGVSEEANDKVGGVQRSGLLFDGSAPYYVAPALSSIPTPYRSSSSPITYGAGESITGLNIGWVKHDQHYFLEIAVAIDAGLETSITDETSGGVNLHWTMGCGNDFITVQDSTPFEPIPEPTTMVLLGMGVVGMALRARRPMC